jgi:hypothetical protein
MHKIKLVISSRIPDALWKEIRNFKTSAERFGVEVSVSEETSGSTKCAFCGKKFSDIYAARAYTRLKQHIADKHESYLKTIQTPTQASRGDRSWNETFYHSRGGNSG